MIFVDEDNCTGCGDCLQVCPQEGAIVLQQAKAVINHDFCIGCAACMPACPKGAIYEVEPAPVAAFDAKAEPVPRAADTAAVARPAKPARTLAVAFPKIAPSPLWVGVIPVAARFVGGLAGWWLDRRRLAAWDRGGRESTRRGPRGKTLPAAPPMGSAGLRRRSRRGRGR